MTGRTELNICQGNVIGLYHIDNVNESIVVPYVLQHGGAFISEDDIARGHSAPVVQDHTQFRRITTLPWPAKFPSPSQLNICGTSSGDVSGESLTSHRTSTSSLIYSGGMAPDPPSNNWTAHQEHEASLSRVAGGERRPYSLLRLL